MNHKEIRTKITSVKHIGNNEVPYFVIRQQIVDGPQNFVDRYISLTIGGDI